MKKVWLLVSLVLALVFILIPVGISASSPTVDTHKYVRMEFLSAKNPTTWEALPLKGQGTLFYNPSCDTFDFLFVANNLPKNTRYSLIYYADKPDRFVNWGGDYPGFKLWGFTSDKYGCIYGAGSVDLGMDLPSQPDINPEAKIWLVPASDYDVANCKLINWNPDKYLFEWGKGVNYKDTQVKYTGLVQKDSSWSITNPSTFGCLWYSPQNYYYFSQALNPKDKFFAFKFNGYGLMPNTSYDLIYYADPYPGNNGAFLAKGITTANGWLQLIGKVKVGSMPFKTDANYPTGAKIWLVPSSDYNQSLHEMTTWNPSEYLFETQLIKYNNN